MQEDTNAGNGEATSDCVLPGQRLGHVGDFQPGQGTYVRKDYIFASVVGFRQSEVERLNLALLFFAALVCFARFPTSLT